MAPAVYLVAGTALLASLALAAVCDRRSDAAATAGHARRLLLPSLFVLSPNYPWHFLVLVPLGCLRPWPPALTLTLLGFVLYAAPPVEQLPAFVQLAHDVGVREIYLQRLVYFTDGRAWRGRIRHRDDRGRNRALF